MARTKYGPRKTWDENYASLVAYHEQNGHFIFSREGEHKKLGKWLVNQRSNLKKEGLNEIDAARKHKLEQLGIVFGKVKATWDDRINEWKDLQATHGPINGTESFCSDSLKKWAYNTRWEHWTTKEGGKGQGRNLGEERMAQLKEIGFDLDFGVGGGRGGGALDDMTQSALLAVLGTSKELSDVTKGEIYELLSIKVDEAYNALYSASRQADTEFRENLSMHHNYAREKRNEWAEAHVAELEDIADRLVRMKV
mmetsp:Transcript_10025/g.21665  ORF Transcript_10025/g.21665 Transcript_10025/m.21665 type:complete len:253 (+) Transcript_10025:261-1019(+)